MVLQREVCTVIFGACPTCGLCHPCLHYMNPAGVTFTPFLVSIGIWGSPWAVIVAKKKLQIFEGKILELTSKAARDIGGVSVSFFSRMMRWSNLRNLRKQAHTTTMGRKCTIENGFHFSVRVKERTAKRRPCNSSLTFQTFSFRTISIQEHFFKEA